MHREKVFAGLVMISQILADPNPFLDVGGIAYPGSRTTNDLGSSACTILSWSDKLSKGVLKGF